MKFILSIYKDKEYGCNLFGKINKFLKIIGVKDLPPVKSHVRKTHIKFKIENK